MNILSVHGRVWLFFCLLLSLLSIHTDAKIVCNTTVGAPVVDFAFLIDISGSMSPYIEKLTDDLAYFALKLRELNVDARFAIVAFGGKPQILLPFTADAKLTAATLESIETNGGGQEASLEAIRAVLAPNYGADFLKSCSYYKKKTQSDGADTDAYCNIIWRTNAKKTIIVVTDEDSDLPTLSNYRVANQTTENALCATFYFQYSSGRVSCSSSSANFEPNWEPKAFWSRYSTFFRTDLGLTIDPAYQYEIDLTASMVVANDVSVNVLMNSKVNPATSNPQSYYDSRNLYWIATKSNTSPNYKDNLQTTVVQFGDPSLAVMDKATLLRFDATKTLTQLNGNGLSKSLQARVLKAGGYLRLFEINDLLKTNVSSNGNTFAENFYNATANSATSCINVPDTEPISDLPAPILTDAAPIPSSLSSLKTTTTTRSASTMTTSTTSTTTTKSTTTTTSSTTTTPTTTTTSPTKTTTTSSTSTTTSTTTTPTTTTLTTTTPTTTTTSTTSTKTTTTTSKTISTSTTTSTSTTSTSTTSTSSTSTKTTTTSSSTTTTSSTTTSTSSTTSTTTTPTTTTDSTTSTETVADAASFTTSPTGVGTGPYGSTTEKATTTTSPTKTTTSTTTTPTTSTTSTTTTDTTTTTSTSTTTTDTTITSSTTTTDTTTTTSTTSTDTTTTTTDTTTTTSTTTTDTTTTTTTTATTDTTTSTTSTITTDTTTTTTDTITTTSTTTTDTTTTTSTTTTEASTTTSTTTITISDTTTTIITSETPNVFCGDGVVGNGTCTTSGQCCSEYGYCDVGLDYCGPTGISEEYIDPQDQGKANSTIPGSDACGYGIRGNGICDDALLTCSKWGWCIPEAITDTPKPIPTYDPHAEVNGTPTPEPSAGSVPKSSGTNPAVAGGVGAGVLCLGAAAAFFVLRRNRTPQMVSLFSMGSTDVFGNRVADNPLYQREGNYVDNPLFNAVSASADKV